MNGVWPPSFLEIGRFFCWLGAMSWGGFYATLPRIRAQILEQEWIPPAEFDALLAVATLVPGPNFLSLAGLIGYRLRGAAGALVAILTLMAAPTAMVVAAVLFLSSSLDSGPMAPVTRLVTVAMAGVLVGNAWRLMRSGPLRLAGALITVGAGAAIMLGVPVVAAVILSMILGRWLLGGDPA